MDRRYVGIDLHRRRSVIYAMDAEGDKLFCERIDNDALRLLEVVNAAFITLGSLLPSASTYEIGEQERDRPRKGVVMIRGPRAPCLRFAG